MFFFLFFRGGLDQTRATYIRLLTQQNLGHVAKARFLFWEMLETPYVFDQVCYPPPGFVPLALMEGGWFLWDGMARWPAGSCFAIDFIPGF